MQRMGSVITQIKFFQYAALEATAGSSLEILCNDLPVAVVNLLPVCAVFFSFLKHSLA